MKNIVTIKVKNKEDALKYAYAFMPRDLYSASYKENVPPWEDFKTNQTHNSSNGFSCVACLDTEDKKRVNLLFMEDTVLFNCYGDFEKEAKKIFEEIVLVYSSLK